MMMIRNFVGLPNSWKGLTDGTGALGQRGGWEKTVGGCSNQLPPPLSIGDCPSTSGSSGNGLPLSWQRVTSRSVAPPSNGGHQWSTADNQLSLPWKRDATVGPCTPVASSSCLSRCRGNDDVRERSSGTSSCTVRVSPVCRCCRCQSSAAGRRSGDELSVVDFIPLSRDDDDVDDGLRLLSRRHVTSRVTSSGCWSTIGRRQRGVAANPLSSRLLPGISLPMKQYLCSHDCMPDIFTHGETAKQTRNKFTDKFNRAVKSLKNLGFPNSTNFDRHRLRWTASSVIGHMNFGCRRSYSGQSDSACHLLHLGILTTNNQNIS